MSLPFPASNDDLLARVLDTAFRALQRGDLVVARLLLGRALARAEAGGDHAAMLQAHQLLGHVALGLDELAQARHHHRTALRGSRSMGLALGVASSLHNLGLVAVGEGRPWRARTLVAAAAAVYARSGHPEAAATAYANLERLAAGEQEVEL